MPWIDENTHVTFGSEAHKLSADEIAAEVARWKETSAKRFDEKQAADAVLAGMPFVAVPTEQLADLYGRMLRLIRLGQTNIKDFQSTSPEIRALRQKIFTEADFGAVFAGQWLPRDVQQKVRDKNEDH